jgi:hypothetical protein
VAALAAAALASTPNGALGLGLARLVPCPPRPCRILHWGSKGRKGYHTPRVSMSFGCADDGYEPAYFSRKHLPFPPLALRVALVCAQVRRRARLPACLPAC